MAFVLFCVTGFSAIAQSGVQDSVSPAVKELLDSWRYRKYDINKLQWLDSTKSAYDIELQKKEKLIFLEVRTDGEVLSKEKGKEFIYDNTKDEIKQRDGGDEVQPPPPMPRL